MRPWGDRPVTLRRLLGHNQAGCFYTTTTVHPEGFEPTTHRLRAGSSDQTELEVLLQPAGESNPGYQLEKLTS